MNRGPSFPKDHHLIVTTVRGVYSWDADGITLLFRSGSGGIMAAKKATNDSNILAVADGQVVILHDLKRGMQKRSYRLKGSDVGSVGCFLAEARVDDAVGSCRIVTIYE